MDTGLDKNETELSILVLAVTLEMLADSDGLHKMVSTKGQRMWNTSKVATLGSSYLLDQHEQVFGKRRGKS